MFNIVFLIFQSHGYSKKKRFQSHTNSDGISQSEVYTKHEDSREFMWFDTVKNAEDSNQGKYCVKHQVIMLTVA